ncbi:MAG: beta-lactamase family protein, partial [Anaerolineales bacterium]|nr:beta-lactamase family protein [Anaerolineales bacterium]
RSNIMTIKFRLFIAIGILVMLPLLWFMAGNTQELTSTHIAPDGRFSIDIPEHWVDESTADFSAFSHAENIHTYLITVEATDVDSGIRNALDITLPELDSEPVKTTTASAPNGIWTQKVYTLPDGSMTVAVGQFVDDLAYVLILQAPDEASVQSVSDDFTSMLLSFTFGTAIDLTDAQPQAITPDMVADLEAYIQDIRETYAVPGAAVAIVQAGEVIYSQGFGVLESGSEQAVNTDTLFMIGSISKSMTTMMMASLVDDEILDWDTPAREIYPAFSLANDSATEQIRVRDFVNNSSGVSTYNVPRFLIRQTPEQVIESLVTVPLIADPGEAYSYSNLMFAAGGYGAAHAVGANNRNDLHGMYITLMQERIFDPIGMAHTTFDFDAAIGNGNHASPHAFDVVERDLRLLPIDWERFIVPVAPAGASWSNVEDMARYLTTHLNQGVAPNGTVVVSEANLSQTQQAEISIAGDIYYGMGWVIDTYNGLPLLWHNGGTQGFASDIAFLPDAELGVVVLSNKGNADNFTRSVREYVFELSFGLEHEADSRYRTTQAASDAALDEILLGIQFVPAEQAQVTTYLGEYDLGIAILYDEVNGFILDTEYGHVPLVTVIGREETYYARNGLILTFSRDSEGAVTLSIGLLDNPLQTVMVQKRPS